MQTITAPQFGGPDVLELADVPEPVPGHGQVRIRVAAAAVNPVDVATREGWLDFVALPATIGWDVAGHVDALGDGVERFAVGDAVIGLRDLLSAAGTYAEQVVLDAADVAPAPSSASLAAASTLPLNALTADQALDLAGVGAGASVLVTGAAGGLGGYLLELSRLRGLRAIAVAGAADEELVRSLGAAEFVARADVIAPAVRALVPGGVDAVIDAAALGVPAHDALRAGGTYVSVLGSVVPPPLRGTDVRLQMVHADGARLAELSALVDAGALTLRVAETLPLAEAGAAQERLAAGGLRGRIVLEP